MEKKNVAEVFLDVEAHRLTADIIRKFSTNKKDVRGLALDGLNLKPCKAILDLGCGFGFFTEALEGRVHPEASVRGIDIIEAYGPLFLRTCEDAGLRGTFSAEGVHSIRKLEDRQFDLILCSYALYFFPELIPDISRVLRNEGHFIAITHSKENMGELIDAAKEALKEKKMLSEHALPIEGIIRRFSSENGLQLLSPSFDGIRSVDYPNNLVFSTDNLRYIVEYFRFKSPFFLSGTGYSSETVTRLLRQHLERVLLARNQFTISKDDTIFIAEKPLRKRKI
jgi:ubiquinone/menaquinone biosynthesis C-methylase UbiE